MTELEQKNRAIEEKTAKKRAKRNKRKAAMKRKRKGETKLLYFECRLASTLNGAVYYVFFVAFDNVIYQNTLYTDVRESFLNNCILRRDHCPVKNCVPSILCA